MANEPTDGKPHVVPQTDKAQDSRPKIVSDKDQLTNDLNRSANQPRTADAVKAGAVKPVAEQEKDRIEKETGKRPEDQDFTKALDPVGAADLRTAIMNVVNQEFAARGLQVPKELDNVVQAVSQNAAQGHYKVPVADVNPDGSAKDTGSSIAARTPPTPRNAPAPAPRP